MVNKKWHLIDIYLTPQGVDEDSELTLTPQQLETLVDYVLKESAAYLDSEDVSALRHDSTDVVM